MRRRDLLAALPAALALPRRGLAQSAALADDMRRQARALAATPFRPPVNPLPADLAALSYDADRDLRFRPEMAVWRDRGLPFQLQMFHRSGQRSDAVEIAEAVHGRVRPIAYRPEMFVAGPLAAAGAARGVAEPNLGFAGFRIHAPINDPARFDEFAVFLGASYFRAVPRGGAYGLSARGIEIGSGEAGEEFPGFRSFIIERPAADARYLVVHALMEGPSVAGAYRFIIWPGEQTVFDVTAVLYPRRPLAKVGIAPLTSMFLFGPEQPRRFDDFRPEVHDSDSLLADAGPGERLWRPLFNPQQAEIVEFGRPAPGGFGLLQRRRTVEAYEDLEASYHLRPGAWVQPMPDAAGSGWGAGAVRLVQLPEKVEFEDNIVASWRPAQALAPGREHCFAYRILWSRDPAPPLPLAQASLWRTGAGDAPGRRRFIVEFSPFDPATLADVAPEVTASNGQVLHATLQPNIAAGSARLSFQLDPGDAATSDLTARLSRPSGAVSETWCWRWRGAAAR